MRPGLRFLSSFRALTCRHRRALLWLWVAGLVVLAPLSLLPQTAPPTGIGDQDLALDKVFHVIAYGGLTALAMTLFEDTGVRWRAVVAVLAISVIYEIGQRYVPGRSFGWDDLAANVLGVAVGYGAGRAFAGRATVEVDGA